MLLACDAGRTSSRPVLGDAARNPVCHDARPTGLVAANGAYRPDTSGIKIPSPTSVSSAAWSFTTWSRSTARVRTPETDLNQRPADVKSPPASAEIRLFGVGRGAVSS